MANVHNQTAHPLNFVYSIMHGHNAIHVPAGGVNVAVGITAGPVNAAVLGVGGFGNMYPGLPIGNIYVFINGAGHIDINYGP